MAGFFKKALSVFVEFDDNQNQDATNPLPPLSTSSIGSPTPGIPPVQINQAEAEKFEKYFDKLFEQANLPGPDYFEFHKMMETLEAHIPDENARFSATFAALSIQGLTKRTLLDTANKYKSVIEQDKADFEVALKDKLKQEVELRQKEIEDLEKKTVANSELIQKLTKEIADSQVMIGKLKAQVTEEQSKLTTKSRGYQLASQAVINKISMDIQKFQSTL